MAKDANSIRDDDNEITSNETAKNTNSQDIQPNEQSLNGVSVIPNEIEVIELPRSRIIAEAISKTCSLPPDVESGVLLSTTDHIEEARHECVYQFLERVLLPRMRDERPLSARELVEKANGFKDVFRQEHPMDFVGEFELITAVELELMQLHIQYKARLEAYNEHTATAALVEKTLTQVKVLLDKYPDALYPI